MEMIFLKNMIYKYNKNLNIILNMVNILINKLIIIMIFYNGE